jgi:hypothetical protein
VRFAVKPRSLPLFRRVRPSGQVGRYFGKEITYHFEPFLKAANDSESFFLLGQLEIPRKAP